MLPTYLNIRDVDRRVKELVVRLNRLPYIVTISSCEGHVRPSVDGLISWEFDRGSLGIQTNGSYEGRHLVGRLREFCDKYDFVYFISIEPDTEKEINKRLAGANENFRVYGFKFPLGEEAYGIVTDYTEGDKESVIAFKRKINKFWSELTLEISK